MIAGGKGPVSRVCGVADGLAWPGSSRTGATEQPTRLPTIAANAQPERSRVVKRNGIVLMALILLEALLALAVFVLIVWWTMFSGRSKGELPPPANPETPKNPEQDDKTP
jgi:flagellar basal body-associated protein FliL